MMTARLSPEQIGKRIAELRKQKGFSQEDLAKFLKISRSSVAQMELGNRNISVPELIQLSEALGFSLDKFLSKDYKTGKESEKVADSAPARQDMRILIPTLNV